MIEPGALIAGRYRITFAGGRRDPSLAVDESTGENVVLPEHPHAGFENNASVRRVARGLLALGDPRLPILALDPVALRRPAVLGDHWYRLRTATFEPTFAEAVDGSIELLELIAIGRRLGATVSSRECWLERDVEGKSVGRVLIPVGRYGAGERRWAGAAVEVLGGLLEHRNPVTGLLAPGPHVAGTVPAAFRSRVFDWLERTWSSDIEWTEPPSIEPAEILELLLAHSSPRARGAQCADALAGANPPGAPRGTDLDELITLGEEEMLLLPSDEPYEASYRSRRALLLAAYVHRRACLRAEASELAGALRDAERAVALDPHPEHVTTQGLILERAGRDDDAGKAHDAAVAAIAATAPDPISEQRAPTLWQDLRPSWPAKVARTLHARGAFRLRGGNVDGAREDLEASVTRLPTAAALRALAVCRTRLGDADAARTARERAALLETPS